MKSTFRALSNKKFSVLLFGQTLSRIGDFLFQITIAWWVLEKTGSATAMGTVLFFSALPMVVFVLVGGVVVDRVPRGLLLFMSDMARCFIMIVGAWLAFTDQLVLWEIYVIAVLFGFADAFFMPAYTALIQQIVAEEDLPSANSINSLSMQFGRVAGPAIGGLIVGFGGTAFAFIFNALSFFIGALTVAALLNIPAPAREQKNGFTLQHFKDDLRDGFSTIFSFPVLWGAILIFAITNITLGGTYAIAMPFLVQQKLGGDEKMLGFIYAIFPIGYALASLAMGGLQRIRFRGLILFISVAVAGIGLGVFGLGLPLYILVFAALINGAANEMGMLVWSNLMQELVPPEKMGRVSSVDMLGSFVLLPVGFALTGWLVDKIGVATVFVAAGGITAAVSLLPLLHPAIRRMD
jgi:DHA3 family tetracycline resistance protein-like MFS transporter